MPRKLTNLIGLKFGRLEVLSYFGLVPCGKQKQSAWLCKCNCGNIVKVLNCALKSGSTSSCGCFHKEKLITDNLINITNKIFGKLKVIEYGFVKKRKTYWKCQCECGTIKYVAGNSLQSGHAKSCGCRQGWFRAKKPGLWKNPAEYAKWLRSDPVKKLRNGVSNSIRGMLLHNGSYKRKKSIINYLPYTIGELRHHLENLWEPWMNWQNYGGKSSDPRRTWHIHHIKPHSHFNYTSMEDDLFKECWALDNLMPLDKLENISKGNRY